jgi:hypothetical protein
MRLKKGVRFYPLPAHVATVQGVQIKINGNWQQLGWMGASSRYVLAINQPQRFSVSLGRLEIHPTPDKAYYARVHVLCRSQL